MDPGPGRRLTTTYIWEGEMGGAKLTVSVANAGKRRDGCGQV